MLVNPAFQPLLYNQFRYKVTVCWDPHPTARFPPSDIFPLLGGCTKKKLRWLKQLHKPPMTGKGLYIAPIKKKCWWLEDGYYCVKTHMMVDCCLIFAGLRCSKYCSFSASSISPPGDLRSTATSQLSPAASLSLSQFRISPDMMARGGAVKIPSEVAGKFSSLTHG